MKTVDKFIDDVVSLYKLASPTPEVRRSLKFKLGMADIRSHVEDEDTAIALDIVLGSVQKPRKGLLRVANTTRIAVGTCPRCRRQLVEAKLNDSRLVGYCEGCRVAVPV